MDTTTLGIHYAWESFLTLNKKMIPLWLQFPLQKMMKQWTEERPVELKVLHQMSTRRWDMGTRRYPLRHRTVTTSRHVSSLLVTPWERQGNEVELIHCIVQRNLDNLVSKVQCQRKFFMWSVKNVANKSLEIEMRGKVNLFKFDVSTYPAAGNCFQKTRYPAVRNFDQFSRNSSFNSSKNTRYLFRNVKRL